MQGTQIKDQDIELDVTVLRHPRAVRSGMTEPKVLWTPELGYFLGDLYEEYDAAGTRVYARTASVITGHTPSIELIEQTLADLLDGKPVPEALRPRELQPEA